MNKLASVAAAQLKTDLPQFKSGDRLKIHMVIKEGAKERIQLYEGVCIKRHNKGLSSSFTVRKTSDGVGVERIFPLHSPLVKKIEVLAKGRVRRSKLYYLRDLSGKAASIREELVHQKKKEKPAKAADK